MDRQNQIDATRMTVDNLEPGMIVVTDVTGIYGDVVVKSGTLLTDPFIRRIKISGAKAAYVLIASIKEAQTQKIFYDIETKQTKMIDSFNTIFEDKVVDQANILGMVNESIAFAKEHGGINKYLNMLHQKTEYTYTHCMSVSILSSQFGEWVKLSDEDLSDLVLAGSLHDIGKLEVGIDLINKPDRLSDEEYSIIKEHVLRGCNLLKTCNIPKGAYYAILEHHERLDGLGYPFQKDAKRISKLGKMLTILDVYDALVSKRSYRDAMCPFLALEIMEKDAGRSFDPGLFKYFETNVVLAYLNAKVQVSDTELAEITEINPDAPLKPVIRYENGDISDMSKKYDLRIVKVFHH